jgi:hypothetical protein
LRSGPLDALECAGLDGQSSQDLTLVGESRRMAELAATFSGTATLQIADDRFPGPHVVPLAFSPVFSADRKAVDLGPFPPSSVGPMDTPLGSNTITISKKAGGAGSFDSGSGAMQMPLTLRVDHSLPGLLVGDSDLPLVLTTDAATSPAGAFVLTGSPVSPTGVVTLVAASAFKGGYLGGTDCAVSITGTLLPSPFVTD